MRAGGHTVGDQRGSSHNPGIEATISHPTQSPSYAVDADGRPMIRPGMAGVCYNARVGDRVFGWAADHLEPGVFGWAADHLEPGVSAGHPQARRYQALQFWILALA